MAGPLGAPCPSARHCSQLPPIASNASLEGSRLPSGLYFVRIAGERFTAARRLAAVR